MKETEWQISKENYEKKIAELEGELKAHENINIDLLKRKRGRSMNAKETLKLVSKTWCNINDLMKLTGLSRSSVLKIRNKIKEQLNYEIHTRDLPMNVVVDYLKIDIDYLKVMSTREEKSNENDK